MSSRERRPFPSATLIGALLGIAGALLLRPPMMLAADGTIAWLLFWTVSGLATGAVVEILAHRVGGKVESPLEIKSSASHSNSLMRPPTDTLWAWGRRYSCVGAGLGLVIGYLTATTIPHLLINLVIGPVYGAMVGAALGVVGRLVAGPSTRAIRTSASHSPIEGATATNESGPVVGSGPAR